MPQHYFRLLALLLVLTSTTASATHSLGGDMSYKYLGAAQYELTVRYYTDCHHGDPKSIEQDAPIFISAFIGRNLLFTDSIAISASGSIHPSGAGCYQDTNHTCISWVEFRKTYTFTSFNDSITFMNQRCCMTWDGSNILEAGSNGVTLYTTIAPNTAGSGNNSGPAFHGLPPARACINEQFLIDFGSTDPDGDSLSYHLETGYRAGTSGDAKPIPRSLNWLPLFYVSGFNPVFPLGPNGNLNLEQNSGMLSGTCSVPGEYLICIVCESYRNGVWNGRSTRQYVLTIDNCGKALSALVKTDSLSYLIGGGIGISVCGGNKMVSFKNLSFGATEYFWDFGVQGVSDDTSTAFEPSFTYPSTGTFPLSLIAKNETCSDTFRTLVLISNDVLSADFSASGGPCVLDVLYLLDKSTSSGSAIRNSYWLINSDLYTGSSAWVQIQQAGTFDIRHYVVSNSGCLAEVIKPFTAIRGAIHASNDTTVVRHSVFNISASGGVSYTWAAISPAAFSILNPTSPTQTPYTGVPGKDFMFVVAGKDADGCGAIDTVLVTVSESGYVFVPTGFTPNGVGRNDELRVRTSGQHFVSFSIYNRLGNRVFYSESPQKGWDGRYEGSEAPTEVYFWMVRTKDPSGNEIVSKGQTTLLR